MGTLVAWAGPARDAKGSMFDPWPKNSKFEGVKTRQYAGEIFLKTRVLLFKLWSVYKLQKKTN